MTEKLMQTMFGKYLEANPPLQSELYELKICKKSSIPFNAVQPHQIAALLKATTTALYHKIADSPVSWGAGTAVRFTAKKPFDCFILVGAPAYIVIWFYHPRGKKVFIKISIGVFLQEMQTSVRKSLTETRALEIGIPLEI